MPFPTDEDVRARIDELEALVNGLMIYIASKEAGVALEPEGEPLREFIKSHLYRAPNARLQQTGSLAVPGGFDRVPFGKIAKYREDMEQMPK